MTVKTFAIAAALLGSVFAGTAHANLVTNGGFSMSSYSGDTEFGTAYSQANQQGVTGWTGNNGYDIWFVNASTATSPSGNTTGQYSPTGKEYLWAAAPSPIGGGAFIGLDGDQSAGVQGGISQMITGLTVGASYTLDFDWAGAQLVERSGATTDQLSVSLGSQTFSTASVANASQGFTGWMHQSFTFTASAASEVLSFLSIGTPAGLPPMALLDNVSLNATAVPEPMTLSLVGAGLAGLAVVRRRRKAA